MGTKIKCILCEDIIESKHRHDFVTCSCRSCFVDGGNDYLRIGGNLEMIRIIDENGNEREVLAKDV